MRGIYWKEMPNYKQLNALNNTNKLPDFFWTGKTKMNCLKHAIGQSLDTAYAHHIQRLMIIGNIVVIAIIVTLKKQGQMLVHLMHFIGTF